MPNPNSPRPIAGGNLVTDTRQLHPAVLKFLATLSIDATEKDAADLLDIAIADASEVSREVDTTVSTDPDSVKASQERGEQ